MNSGKAIRQKIRDAIKAKLVDLGSYVDEELPDYIMVMLANKRSEAQMTQDLDLFLNNNTTTFTSWLFDLLRKLEHKPTKGEKKKKKKDKGSKHKSQKAEASSSHEMLPSPSAAETTKPADLPSEVVAEDPPPPLAEDPSPALPTDDPPVLPPPDGAPVLPPPGGESSAPIISILPDTDDVLDKELTEEIDADRKKAKQLKKAAASQQPSQVKKTSPLQQVKKDTSPAKPKKLKSPPAQDGSSYREHVIKQRAAKVEPISPTKPLEKAQGTPALRSPERSQGPVAVGLPERAKIHPALRGPAQSTTAAVQRTGVKLRLGERLVQEVIVDPEMRRRKSPGSVLAQVIHHEEESSDDEELPKRVASSVRANRRPTLPTSRQANTALLKRAVSEATASTSTVPERQAPLRPVERQMPARPIAAQMRVNRSMIRAATRPLAVKRAPQTTLHKLRSTALSNISSSSDRGIQSRSMQRELQERDFDSQSFQTIDDQGEEESTEDDIDTGQEVELVQLVTSPAQEGVFVYKNVVAVMGSPKAKLQPVKGIQEIVQEEVPVISQEEVDSRQIYVDENVSVADSTQSPEHPSEEDEMVQEYQPDQGTQGNVAQKSAPAGGANPRFVVTLEGAKKHLKLSANQRRKNQKKTVKRGFVQPPHQTPEEAYAVKQPRRTISPEVPRQFVFTETETSMEEEEEDVTEAMAEEEDERTAVIDQEPYMVFPAAPYQTPAYQPVPYPAAPKVEPLTISMQDSDDDEGYEADDPPQDAASNKSNERCKFWPACKNGDSCPYIHPTTPCRTFPHCKFGEKCLYIHPNCRFDSLCTKPSCPYTHATRKSLPPVVLQMTPQAISHPPPPPRQGSQTICKFHPGCTNRQCPFLHPRVCRFGKTCSRQGCTFFHSSVAHRSALTWTKNPESDKTPATQHISQRQFAAPLASPAPVLKLSPVPVRKPKAASTPTPMPTQ